MMLQARGAESRYLARTHETAPWRLVCAVVGRRAGDPLPEAAPEVWEETVALGQRHGVLPLLDRFLRAEGAGLAPPATCARIAESAAASAHSNTTHAQQLVDLLRLFKRADIRAIPFKGPELSQLVYGDLTLRPVRDLDVAVHPEDLDRAIELMVRRGDVLHPQLSPAQMSSYRRTDCQVWVEERTAGICIELHWAFRETLYAFPLPVTHVLDRASEMQLLGRSIPCLRKEDLVVVLAFHGLKHGWNELKSLADLHRLLEGSPLDWEEIAAIAERAGCLRATGLALDLTRQVLGTRLPEEVERLVARDPRASALAAAYAQLLGQPSSGAKRTRRRLYLAARESLRARADFVWGMAFTPSLVEWSAVPLPDQWFPLYFAIRPLRLVARPVLRRLRLLRPSVL